jgi:antitoxin (DNA-binding transcriptional repressor) of toxin-antitoxin stability system
MPTDSRTPAVPPKTINAFEFEARFPELLEEVRRCRRTLLITRRGRPIAQLSPFPRGRKIRGKKATRIERERKRTSSPLETSHNPEETRRPDQEKPS